jgi:hypothetical protein
MAAKHLHHLESTSTSLVFGILLTFPRSPAAKLQALFIQELPFLFTRHISRRTSYKFKYLRPMILVLLPILLRCTHESTLILPLVILRPTPHQSELPETSLRQPAPLAILAMKVFRPDQPPLPFPPMIHRLMSPRSKAVSRKPNNGNKLSQRRPPQLATYLVVHKAGIPSPHTAWKCGLGVCSALPQFFSEKNSPNGYHTKSRFHDDGAI